MKPFSLRPRPSSDFRRTSTMAIGYAALLVLTPFVLNNFLQGRVLLGAAAGFIIAVLALNAWRIRRGRSHSVVVLWVLVPCIVGFLMLSFRNQGIIGALWCFPAVLAFYFMLPERQAWLANTLLLAGAFPMAWLVLESSLATRVIATLMVVSAFSAIFIRVIERQRAFLERQAVTDPLTGLLNRSRLREALEQAIAQGRRQQVPMTLIALDLDHFKQVNDEQGHDVGDAVLLKVAELLQGRMRKADTVFRLGGEEFLVLLFGTAEAPGRHVAETLRLDLSGHEFPGERRMTASFGVAGWQDGDDWQAWMKRADERLYAAKAAGRDCVVAG